MLFYKCKKKIMKKLLLAALFSVFLLNSCQNEELDSISNSEKSVELKKVIIDTTNSGEILPILESPLKQFFEGKKRTSKLTQLTSTSSSLSPSTLYDLIGIPLNIIVKSNTSNNRFLTSQGTGNLITLATENTGNSNQRFTIGFMPLTGYIYIKNVQGNLVSAGTYTNNPDVNVLYVKSSTSTLGATWDFIETTTPGYILQNADVLGFDGPVPTFGNVYNMVIGADGNSIYFDKYRNQTKQEFEIRVVDDFEIQSIEYLNDPRVTLTQVPDFIVNWSYSNGSSVAQSMTTNFGSKASKTSSFTQNNSFSLKVSTKFETGIPFLASGEIQTEVGTSHSFTYGENETVEDTRSYNFPLIVPAKTKVVATAKVTQFKLSVPYIATLKGKNTGKIIRVAGVWEGVDLTDVDVIVTETNLTSRITSIKSQFKKFESN